MKKSILIISTAIIVICISAFSYKNSSKAEAIPEKTVTCNSAVRNFDFVKIARVPTVVDFFYDVAPRYNRTFTKTEMAKVRSAYEFENLDAKNPKHIFSYSSVAVLIIDDSYEPIQEVAGETAEFNEEQLELLRSLPYSADVLIKTEYLIKNNDTGEIEESYTTPHITIVPETEAKYMGGNDAFLDYLKKNSIRDVSMVQKEKLQPGKIRFTIARDGVITSATLISACGYPSIDKSMLKLISKTPGKWEAAKDAEGINVEQQLVFSYGIVGC